MELSVKSHEELAKSRRCRKLFSSSSKREMVEFFNSEYGIGTKVLVLDNGKVVITKTVTKAELLGGSTPAIKLKGINGMFALDKIIVLKKTAVQSDSGLS